MPLFTKETAEAAQILSLEARRRNRILNEQRLQRELAAAFIPQPIPQAQAQIPEQPDDDFCERRIARVRRQLNAIDAMMSKETDPQRLDRLASAQSRVSEQERILSGRPLPGSNRPRQAKVAKVGPRSVEPE